MRKLIVIVVVIALIVGGTIAYLVATTPQTAPLLRFPLTTEQQQFLSRVPATADAFAYIPAVAVVHQKFLANPVTRQPLLEWTEKQPLPRPWMLGGADLLVWRSGKSTSYAIRFDGVRATIVRIWTMIAGPHDARWDGNVMLIADPAPAAPPLDYTIANGLSECDAFVVQRNSSRGAFPPIARPAFSSIRITPKEILVVSRAHTDEPTPATVIKPSYRKGAMLSVGFAEPPRILGDMNRLLGTDIRALVATGGAISLYDVDAGLLLPRPKGVIAIRADDAGRKAIDEYRKFIELVGQIGEKDGQLLVSFDQRSLGTYINDAIVEAAWPANRWAGRIDPAKLNPVLRRLGDNPGLRYAAPRIYRSARDLRSWIDALENAESVEAAESATGGVEELRVRIVSK